jgi:hypothetical protein
VTKHLSIVVSTLLAGLALALALTTGLLLLSGCAGGSSTGGQGGASGLRNGGEVPALPAIYSDPTYGFTLQIDGTLEKDDASSSTDAGNYLIVWKQIDGPTVEGQAVNTIAVGVEDKGAEMSPAEVETAIAAMLSDSEGLATSLGDEAVVGETTETTIDESPAVVVEATMVGPDGATPVTARIAYVFQGRYIFTIWCSATSETWAEIEPFYQASILSFTAQ